MSHPSLPALRLQIKLLGEFRISIDGQPVDEALWTRRNSRNLLKILALARKHEMPREEILTTLWPELNGEQALNSLHKALHTARRALEPDLKAGASSHFLITQDQKLVLRAPGGLVVDALEFEQQARTALASANPEQLRGALSLHTGSLLPEDRLEDWSAIFREQLSHLHQELLVAIAQAEANRGDSRAAIDLLMEAVTIEPANERAHRELMRLYVSTGSRHLALNQYRVLTDKLRRDLEAEPEPASVQLYTQILEGLVSPIPGTPPTESQLAETQLAETQFAQPQVAQTQVAQTVVVEPPGFEPTRTGSLAKATRRRWLAGGLATAALFGAGAYWKRDKFLASKPNSLAVLPFAVAGDPELEYLGDGLSEGLIDSLSQIQDLRVMARSTIFSYRDKGRSPREVGLAVGVGAILTGEVTKPPQGPPQITMELVDSADGARLWGGRYRLDPSSLPSLPSKVTYEVARVLSRTLEDQQRERLARRGSASPKAYQLYLYGRHHWNKRTTEEYRKAIPFFEQAISEDPNFALAYAGLADCHGLLSFEGGQTHQYMPKARQFAERAIALNEQLAEGHTSLAMVNALYEWRWPKAEAEFRRAIELNPSHATAHHWYAVHLNAQGQRKAAEEEFARALSLDPLSPIILTNSGYPAHYAREYPAAVQAYQKALALDRTFLPAHQDLMLAYEQMHDYPRALEEAYAVLSLGGDHTLANLVRTAAGSPVTAKSYAVALRKWQSVLEEQAKAVYVAPLGLGSLAARNGDRPTAFRWLFKGLEERSAPLVYLKVDPLYDPIRDDPRFRELLAKIGLI